MRELKFRAKKTDDGDWIVGSYIHSDECPVIREFGGNEYSIDLNTLGQYTGFKDWKDREIFEGDILKYTTHNKSEDTYFEEYCKVIWKDVWGMWIVCPIGESHKNITFERPLFGRCDYHSYPVCPDMEWYADRVGNIYDNSELL